MTAPYVGLSVIGATILLGLVLARMQEHRDGQAAEAARRLPATAHGPAARLHAPAERPLDDGEAEALARIEAGMAADAEWECVWAAVTADWSVAR